MHQPYTINQPYQQSRHRGRVLAAIQKVFAVFYHNKFKKNMPENLELPGEWKYASEVGFVRLKLRRIVVVRIIFYIFMGCAITSSAFGEDPIQQRLDQLYAEYETIVANPTIKKYVELDGKLRVFILEELRKFDGLVKIEKPEDYYKYDNERTRALGIETSKYAGGTYSQALVYSEKFLVKAHEVDPYSKYREYTLFSQILGVRSYHGLGEMPNIKVAYQYAKAFPNGPFIADV